MMPSCSPFTKHHFYGGGPPSESQSEISSVDSGRSDLKAIALQLGVDNPDDLITERFKVDRTKLESMMRCESTIDVKNRAENFFDSVSIPDGIFLLLYRFIILINNSFNSFL